MRLEIRGNKQHGFYVAEKTPFLRYAISNSFSEKEHAYRWAIRFLIKRLEKIVNNIAHRQDLDYEINENYYSIIINHGYKLYKINCKNKLDGYKQILRYYIRVYNKVVRTVAE